MENKYFLSPEFTANNIFLVVHSNLNEIRSLCLFFAGLWISKYWRLTYVTFQVPFMKCAHGIPVNMKPLKIWRTMWSSYLTPLNTYIASSGWVEFWLLALAFSYLYGLCFFTQIEFDVSGRELVIPFINDQLEDDIDGGYTREVVQRTLAAKDEGLVSDKAFHELRMALPGNVRSYLPPLSAILEDRRNQNMDIKVVPIPEVNMRTLLFYVNTLYSVFLRVKVHCRSKSIWWKIFSVLVLNKLWE